ncbi:Transcription termination factor like [Actinidia chinensis var. chinensis]|uniref:Transcription termination factor like n=1 Tax=Actinidia chinensis var. chinensis TaxID=1590841 RepID=A0A2R6P4E0_ACTCC|nr:Transcription termination factor like [Actinidia chinensis var. chinensis]
MFKFICKTSHHLRSATRVAQSPTHNLCFCQIHPFSSSLESIKNSPNQHSFTVNYLINSCGFSPEKSLSASKYVKFETPDKPDSVLRFFETHEFTKTQISRIIRKLPRLLVCDPESTLLPKLEFLKSKGISSTDVAKMVSISPFFMKRSLENKIIPSFILFTSLFRSEEKTITAIKRCPSLLLHDQHFTVAPNIENLQEANVPIANIMYLLANQPRVFFASSNRFREIVKEVETMGFNPLKLSFVTAVHALRSMTKSIWEKKFDVYKNWGWTEDEILKAFRMHPWCMTVSEDKINRVMEFWVNKMGWKSSLLARRPKLLSQSLEKRIVPRCAVYQIMLSKGLIKSKGISLMRLVEAPEEWFLEKLVNRHEEAAPELLKLYKEKLTLSK